MYAYTIICYSIAVPVLRSSEALRLPAGEPGDHQPRGEYYDYDY